MSSRTHTTAKLVVTTAARPAPGSGPVLVETKTGGVGVSSLQFSFTTGEVSHPPDVSGISPREGLVGGGQRVVLRGSNLGESKSDVVRVVIAGVDCTETLEYFSQCKHTLIFHHTYRHTHTHAHMETHAHTHTHTHTQPNWL